MGQGSGGAAVVELLVVFLTLVVPLVYVMVVMADVQRAQSYNGRSTCRTLHVSFLHREINLAGGVAAFPRADGARATGTLLRRMP